MYSGSMATSTSLAIRMRRAWRSLATVRPVPPTAICWVAVAKEVLVEPFSPVIAVPRAAVMMRSSMARPRA